MTLPVTKTLSLACCESIHLVDGIRCLFVCVCLFVFVCLCLFVFCLLCIKKKNHYAWDVAISSLIWFLPIPHPPLPMHHSGRYGSSSCIIRVQPSWFSWRKVAVFFRHPFSGGGKGFSSPLQAHHVSAPFVAHCQSCASACTNPHTFHSHVPSQVHAQCLHLVIVVCRISCVTHCVHDALCC